MLCGAAVKELNLSCYIGETLLITIFIPNLVVSLGYRGYIIRVRSFRV